MRFHISFLRAHFVLDRGKRFCYDEFVERFCPADARFLSSRHHKSMVTGSGSSQNAKARLFCAFPGCGKVNIVFTNTDVSFGDCYYFIELRKKDLLSAGFVVKLYSVKVGQNGYFACAIGCSEKGFLLPFAVRKSYF